MSWLNLGPLAVCMESPEDLWPWPWPVFRARRPGARARWSLGLRAARAAVADGDGLVRREPGGCYRGPGFELKRVGDSYDARVASPVALMGALAAALIDRGPEAGFGLLHGATLAVRGAAVAVLGASGAGKSTLAARHPARVLGANAALVWPYGDSIRVFPLPLTGHGDASIRPEEARLVGGWWLERAPSWLEGRPRALTPWPPLPGERGKEAADPGGLYSPLPRERGGGEGLSGLTKDSSASEIDATRSRQDRSRADSFLPASTALLRWMAALATARGQAPDWNLASRLAAGVLLRGG